MKCVECLFLAASLGAAACGSSSSVPPANDAGGGNSTADSGHPNGSGDGGAADSGAAKSDGGGGGKDSGSVSSPDSGSSATPAPYIDAGPLLACTNSQALTTTDAGATPAPGVVSGMKTGPGTFVAGCQIFPANNAWNVDVSSPSIATTTAYTLPTAKLHPDLGGWSSTPYGIPFNVVPAAQPNQVITFNLYGSESDPGPAGWTTNPAGGGDGVTAYPIPNNAHIEGDPPQGTAPGDDHLLVLQQGATCGAPCTLWETWATVGGSQAPWVAANGATWNLGSNALRPLGYTSADAAGLSVFAGLLRIAEVKAGVVTHAIRVTFNKTQKGYVYPATHFAGSQPLGSAFVPMGLRLRLKASLDTSAFSPAGKIVATAMKTYGLIVGDIGSDWYFQGDSDDAWNQSDPGGKDSYVGDLITDFGKVSASDFDVLDTGTPIDTAP